MPKHIQVRIRIAAIIILAALALSVFAGCSAINDPVVVKVGDVSMKLSDYTLYYNNYYMYVYYGLYDVSTKEGREKFQDVVFDALKSDAVKLYMARQEGITLTEEELKECEDEAAKTMDNIVDNYKSSVDSNIKGELAILAEARRLAEADMKSNGYTYDSYYAEVLVNAQDGAKIEKHMQQIYDTVSVTDDEVKEWYDETLKTQKEEFDDKPEEYAKTYTTYAQGSGVRPLYIPEGYKRAKHILIKDGDKAEETLKKVQQAIEAGDKTFDELIEEYGEDGGMKSEPYKSEGYPISEANKGDYHEEFSEAALKLEKVGDISEPVKTKSGTHIIMLSEIVETETLELNSELEEEIHEYMLTEAQKEKYEEILKGWLDDAPVTEYRQRIRRIGVA